MKKYNKKHDSYYDDEKDVWLEGCCYDKECPSCSGRPNKPSEVTA